MKETILTLLVFCVFCLSVFSQKMTEPKLLGSYIAGEETGEFLLHRVMEASEEHLKDNPNGRLIVRICSSDDFSTAFIKAPISPLAAGHYNVWTKRIIVPYEKIFIANSPKCLEKNGYVFNEYWFVSDKNTIEYEEIFSVNEILYKNFVGIDYDFENAENGKEKDENEQFAENIAGFVNELKNNENAEGFITYLSINKKMKRNIAKATASLKKENIDLNRVKSLMLTRLMIGRNEKLVRYKDKNETFPALQIVTIKNKQGR